LSQGARAAWTLVATMALACAPTSAQTPATEHGRFGTPTLSGVVLNRGLAEMSGLAGSLRHDELLWTLNDSDNPNEIYALQPSGTLRATVLIRDQRNVDWEDLAAFRLDGVPYLLIADVGDNNASRQELRLIVVVEPEVDAPHAEIQAAWVVRVRYPDGARDCEAVAVDAERGEVLLLSKRRVPAQLFEVPLKPDSDAPVTARQIARVINLPQPSAQELEAHPSAGRYFGQPTAMALSPDRGELAVLTYRDVYVYERRPEESWQETLARAPRALGIPLLPQAEGLGYARDGSAIYVTGERLPAPIVRVPRERQ
jgi:hypothetical protein